MNQEIYNKITDLFRIAKDSGRYKYHDAACLSTLGEDGFVDSRIVLVRWVRQDGFVFFTNKNSKKGADLRYNTKAALCFYWDILEKQLRIQGSVRHLEDKDAEEYFDTRPFESKIGAWTSRQSEPMLYDNELKDNFDKFLDTYKQEVPKPQHWGGYVLEPIRVEFWAEGDFRLHDRLVYTKNNKGIWQKTKLFP